MASGTLEHEHPSGAAGDRPARRISEFTPADAAAVAVLFNSSEEGWPGGFMRGVVKTPELVLRRQYESAPLVTFLSWEGDEVAGYCSFYDFPGEQGVAAYVGLLNAATRFHGRGHGRDLLRTAVQRAVDGGYRRLDLHTWPGNMKAVPLYKKTGFFWVPETEVHMENYLPLLLTMPALASFWAEADWYTTYQRALDVHEDLIFDGKMRVYPYEFRHGDRYVRATIDATARGLTRLETERWSVSCTVDDRRLIVGRPRTVRWEVENRTGRPLPLTLLAHADRGLRLRKEETVVVDDRYTAEALLEADSDYQPPAIDQPDPRITSLLLLDGLPVRLETGVEIKPPLDLRLDPLRVTLLPHVTREVPLRLRNAMDEAATARLIVIPSPGLTLELPDAGPAAEAGPRTLDLSLEPEGYAGATLRLRADTPGLHTLELRAAVQAAGAAVPMAPLTLPLPAVGSGELISLEHAVPAPEHAEREVSAREVRVETISHRLVVELRQGDFRLEDPATGAPLVGGRLLAGPPFGWATQWRVAHEATVERRDGGLCVTLRGAAPHLPGCIVAHRLTLFPDGLLRLDTTLATAAEAASTPQAMTSISGGYDALPRIVLPTVHGLISTTSPDFPDWGDLELQNPSVYAEGWIAREGDGRVVGVMWSDVASVRTGPWSLVDLTQDPGALPPAQSRTLAPVYLYAGPGTWRTVRSRWRSLLAPAAPRESEASPRDVVQVRGLAVPGALLAGSVGATLSSVAGRAEAGTLTFEAPAGWTITPPAREVSDLRVGHPHDLRMTVARAATAPRAASLRARLRTERADTLVLDGSVLDLGGAGSVTLTDEVRHDLRVLEVSNGYLRFDVAPAFLGSMIGLRTIADGMEHLLSAFPAAREFGWMRPWFGGLHPVIYPPGENDVPFLGRLTEEQFEAAEAQEQGHDGRVWRGVTVYSRLRSRGLRGLELRATYLTLPESTIVAARLAVRNHSTAALAIQAGVVAYLQPGGTVEGAELVTDLAAERRLLRGQRTVDVGADGWLAVRPGGPGPVIAAVGGRQMDISGIDWGTLGAHAAATTALRLAPGEERGGLFFLALAGDDAEARAYRALAGVGTLP